MLSTAELAALVERVSYKPGWRLVVREPDPVQGAYLSVHAELENSYRPGETVPLHIHSPIPSLAKADDAAFLTWLADRLKMIETHELLEWLKLDGEPWIDPHASLDTANPPTANGAGSP